jgi:hypothetical protein
MQDLNELGWWYMKHPEFCYVMMAFNIVIWCVVAYRIMLAVK